jgi:hypothetical protein
MTDIYSVDELRSKLRHLLKRQSETLQARVFGGVSDTEILEYDVRQEVISEIEERLARSAAA